MRNMPPLVAKKIGANGEARFCNLRYRPGMEVPGTAAHLPQAQASRAGNRAGQGYMARQAILTRTAKEWELTS